MCNNIHHIAYRIVEDHTLLDQSRTHLLSWHILLPRHREKAYTHPIFTMYMNWKFKWRVVFWYKVIVMFVGRTYTVQGPRSSVTGEKPAHSTAWQYDAYVLPLGPQTGTLGWNRQRRHLASLFSIWVWLSPSSDSHCLWVHVRRPNRHPQILQSTWKYIHHITNCWGTLL